MTASNPRPSGATGGSCAGATTMAMSSPSAPAAPLSLANICDERSKAVTRCPRRAAMRLKNPVPAPQSRTFDGAGGRRASRAAVHAACIAALAFSIVLAAGNTSPARAQDDDAAQSPASGSDHDTHPPDAAQNAQDAADAAQTSLDSAIEARNQLESDDAPQDQIDAANQAVAQARANKDAAEQAVQRADEASGEAKDDN